MRGTLFAALAGLIGLALAPSPALARASYPDHPVTIVVPFAAGGSADVYARILAQELGKATGQSFIVEDKPGAGAVIGTQYAAKAAPDGYTLLVISNTQTVNESLLKRRPYKLMRDFVPITPINEAPLVLAVRATLPVHSLADLIRLAKAEPGKLNYASSGTGTPYNMAGELFKHMAGLNIVHIPYKGSDQARTDLLSGQVDMMFDAVSTMSPLVASGKVRALGVTSKTRSVVLPDVPTMAQAGLPGYTATLWLGLLAPKGTPKAVVDKLNHEIGEITQRQDIRTAWARSGVTPLRMSPAEFTRFLRQDIVKWHEIVDAAHISVN
ncbi:tripartite tricarboxylate transporter substrate binding protein [Bordetella sp. FB-8]|uniref:Bug family tripartite tricarboxylate transporter substrate binding protein n=1 Tax=Bordetella sp. FB-8 TaxID=1159870 RepID=UPI000366C617|nr:tripartite tricarboxylate transporter substrate binding protein [Bordetella sp. FB-8]